MTDPDVLLAAARSYLGVHESPAGSNMTPFGAWFGWNGQPWCSEFVWCMFQLAGRSDLYPKTASTRVSYPWYVDRGRVVPTSLARPGDVVWFDFSSTLKPVSHVGIVEANLGGGRLQTLEGNTSLTSQDNGGEVMRRTRQSNIVAVGRPAWEATVALRRMYDAAYPPADPPQASVVALYIGGNTPHVATDAEWKAQTDRSGARFRLPIFTRSTGGDPVADARFVVAWLTGHAVPRGACVALDFEARVDAGYLRAFDAAVVAAGWRVVVYGSRSTVLSNPRPSGGYWDAQWSGAAHLNAGSAATQWASDKMLGKPWDANLVADSTPLWDVTGKIPEVADMTADERAALLALRGQIDALAGSLVRQRDDALQLIDHGDYAGEMNVGDDYRANATHNHAALDAKLDALATDVAAIKARLEL